MFHKAGCGFYSCGYCIQSPDSTRDDAFSLCYSFTKQTKLTREEGGAPEHTYLLHNRHGPMVVKGVYNSAQTFSENLLRHAVLNSKHSFCPHFVPNVFGIIRNSYVGEFDQGWSENLQESGSCKPDLRIPGLDNSLF